MSPKNKWFGEYIIFVQPVSLQPWMHRLFLNVDFGQNLNNYHHYKTMCRVHVHVCSSKSQDHILTFCIVFIFLHFSKLRIFALNLISVHCTTLSTYLSAIWTNFVQYCGNTIFCTNTKLFLLNHRPIQQCVYAIALVNMLFNSNCKYSGMHSKAGNV